MKQVSFANIHGSIDVINNEFKSLIAMGYRPIGSPYTNGNIHYISMVKYDGIVKGITPDSEGTLVGLNLVGAPAEVHPVTRVDKFVMQVNVWVKSGWKVLGNAYNINNTHYALMAKVVSDEAASKIPASKGISETDTKKTEKPSKPVGGIIPDSVLNDIDPTVDPSVNDLLGYDLEDKSASKNPLDGFKSKVDDDV